MRNGEQWNDVCAHAFQKKDNKQNDMTPTYFSIEKAEDGGHKQTLE